MALRFEETSRSVETIQHVVARQNVTRQTKTLHGVTVKMARRTQEPCDSISYVRNVVLPMETEHVGINSGRATIWWSRSSVMVC